MPELQRFVWEWPSLVEQLAELNPALGNRLQRACRPIGADRRPDGRLLLVLGCWVPADRAFLEDSASVQLLERGFQRLLDERIELLVTTWPAGDGTADQPPDPLAGLSEPLQEIGRACGGAIKRSFFAATARRGVTLECGYPVLNYRLDFALPRSRVGVEIEGWDWRARTSPRAIERREREQTLGYEGWSIFWFTGAEILKDVDRAVDEVLRAAGRPRR
jgi:very-short-patch-repair endonuclease